MVVRLCWGSEMMTDVSIVITPCLLCLEGFSVERGCTSIVIVFGGRLRVVFVFGGSFGVALVLRGRFGIALVFRMNMVRFWVGV